MLGLDVESELLLLQPAPKNMDNPTIVTNWKFPDNFELAFMMCKKGWAEAKRFLANPKRGELDILLDTKPLIRRSLRFAKDFLFSGVLTVCNTANGLNHNTTSSRSLHNDADKRGK